MLDIKWIREQPELLDKGLKRRGLENLSQKLIALDSQRRDLLTRIQEIQNERNTLAKAIGSAKQKGESADDLSKRASEIKELLPALETQETQISEELNYLLSVTPNIPRDEVPDGKDESGNQLVSSWGDKPTFSFEPKRHFELGEDLGLMDFEIASEMSGARFVVLKGGLCKLERALAQFMLDTHTQDFGYQEVSPPLLVKDDAFYGAGLLPKFADNAFQTTDGRWLIPTAEVSLTNLVREKILEEEQLPLRFTAHTACFRSEAGAAGRDTRGMIRQHQFYKVELVSITHPDETMAEHERMVGCAEEILKRLKLPYRKMLLCAGDMGMQSEKTYDLEVWLPGEDTYREISSCSTCNDFQARRMNARFKDLSEGGKGKNRFVHTLNGSGLAVGRTLIAVLENYQQADGSITIPEVLRPYMNNQETIKSEKF